jgi:hypothetical protein
VAALDIPQKARPFTVLAVAAALFFATAASCVTGISLLFPYSALSWIWELNRPAYIAFARLGRFPGLLLLALAVLCGAMAVGLLKRKRWAWWAAGFLFGVHCLGDLVTLVLYRDVVKGASGILIASLFLLCLLTPATRRYFDVRHDERSS